MIKKNFFFKGYRSIFTHDSQAIALTCCFIDIGALFKNLGFKFTYKQDEDRKSTKQALKKGFDPATQSALANIRQKYPNARDPIDAILKYVIDVDSENDTVDDKINARFKKFVKKYNQLMDFRM